MTDWIRIRGARTHNLRRIDLDIPRGRITALVGVAGAGKSSLAFHTLYAEGYARYMDSISPYIRQFLDQVPRPPLDSLNGLPPAVAVRHRQAAPNPRSIVATSIDLYDYFRILFARGGHFTCPGCGEPLRRWTQDEIVADLDGKSSRIQVAFDYKGDIPFLINRGYYYCLEPGGPARLEASQADRDILVLLDDLDPAADGRARLFEAVDRAISLGRDRVVAVRDGETHIYPVTLRCPRCRVDYPDPDENLFSFNSPRGACPHCRGYGDIQEPDPKKIFALDRSLSAGAVLPLKSPLYADFRSLLLEAARRRGLDIHRPLGELGADAETFVLRGDDGFPGVLALFRFLRNRRYKVQARMQLSRYSTYRPCPACSGARLNPEALGYRIRGRHIAELTAMSVGHARRFFADLSQEDLRERVSPDVFQEIRARLEYLDSSGLDYLNLNRLTFTLSRGEYQRLNLAFILGSTLSDSLLILDQPSADLHPTERRRMVRFLQGLREAGNSVVMVEHDPEMVRAADWVVELGPGAGDEGGTVVFSGRANDFFRGRETLTQQSFQPGTPVSPSPAPQEPFLEFTGLSAHNLKDIDIRLPRGQFTLLCGVSGAGKTTLLRDELARRPLSPGLEGVEYVDASVPAASLRSTVAAFMGAAGKIREWFARQPAARRLGYSTGHFSPHSPRGRCPVCRGRGGREVEMQFLPSVFVPCTDCSGTGLKAEVRKVRIEGLSLPEWFDRTAASAREHLESRLPAAGRILAGLEENGLGYLRLSQSLKTLSEGERQRLKLCRHLMARRKAMLYLVDDPAYGLHPRDLEKVAQLFRRLTAAGHTVVAADHSRELLSRAAWVIELGPGGGERGGKVVFQGPAMDFPRPETRSPKGK